MDITVKHDNVEVASGTLEVDTSVNPTSATFTPDDGEESACGGVVWNETANGAVRFNFSVSNEANGDFPCGANGATYVYRFQGNQDANGHSPSGTVNFPHAGIEDDDNDTWQAGASEDEPYAMSQGAS